MLSDNTIKNLYFPVKNALNVFNWIDCIVNDLIILFGFFIVKCVTTVFVFMKTDTYLEVF